MDLDALRDRARAARRDIGPERSNLDQQRHRLLLESGMLEGRTRIAAYLADDGEADPLPWRHVAEGRTVCFPVVARGEQSITFYRADGPEDLVPGRWGILEPPRTHPVELDGLDAILVPLVVFDDRCHRAGRGRGYYDRTLAALRLDKPSERPVLIGIAHDIQRVAEVPQHDRDVPLDAVVTATTVIHRAD